MSDSINITINGQTLSAKAGEMLIDVADANGITIPRFCYHKKLSVAANCRMCLVEVEKAPKALPACATPINDGMVVNTRSASAIAAQKSTMEFLLINHPLDCPVCDQGGECELQDVAMGFGEGVSQYTEQKRVVRDKNIGSLVATEMTRCIHCTRCVRFSEEIAGMPELGATGRGENVEIGTYIEKSLSSEMSGNIIDICPVGALTAKPSRFSARCWEMTQTASIAPHDCVGTNINVHSINNDVIRVVPNDNEAINECWISDRDRFSYSSLKSDSRLLTPKIKQDGLFIDATWEEALQLITDKFSAQASDDASKIAALVSPSASLEEQYLVQKLIRALGSNNIDYRLNQTDFSADSSEAVMPWLGRSIESLDALDACLLIASNLRKEQPLLGHRIRKAVIHNGAKVSYVNHAAADVNYDTLENIACSAEKLVHELAAIAVSVAKITQSPLSDHLVSLVDKVKAKAEHKNIAQSLIEGDASALLIGQQAINSPYAALIKEIAQSIAVLSNSTLGFIPTGANASGAALAGCVPYAKEAGAELENSGLNKDGILALENSVVLLLGVNPKLDIAGSNLSQSQFAVAVSSYFDAESYADVDVVLPKAAFTETSGTLVNIEGRWQSFSGAVKAKGESRPGWQIINSLMRVLLPPGEFDVNSPVQARDELKALCQTVELNNLNGSVSTASKLPSKPRSLQAIYEESLYVCDEQVRCSQPLLETDDYANQSAAKMNSEQALKEGLSETTSVKVSVDENSAILAFKIDESVPVGCISLPKGLAATHAITQLFGSVSVEAV